MYRHLSRLVTTLLAVCLLFSTAQAQERITRMELIAEQDAVVAGETQWIGLRMRMADHWHVYWQNPGDSGLPTSINWTQTDGAELGPIHWPVPKALPFDFLTNYGYEEEVILPIPLTYTGDADSITLTANVDVLVCKEICIPESDTVSITLPVAQTAAKSADAPAFANTLSLLPIPQKTQGEFSLEGEHITFHLPDVLVECGLEDIAFYPLTESVIENGAERDWSGSEQGDVTLRIAAATNTLPNEISAVLHLMLDTGEEAVWHVNYTHADAVATPADAPAKTSAPTVEELTFISALLFAFLGGIILNAMPCVFPILSLKALKVAKYAGKENATVRKQGISYTLGVLVAFAAIVIPLILLAKGGESIGWGFQLQSPGFVCALALIMFAVGLSLSGLFHLPSFFGSTQLQDGDSARGSFFTGILAVLVATPCTGPFMAPALGFALSQPAVEAFLIFEALALGLAFPYLLISFVPASRALLPKPGIWMERMKEILAFPMYATAAWLLWVLVQQSGANGMLWALGGAVALALALWGSKLHSTSWKLVLWLCAICAISLSVIKQDAAPPMQTTTFSQHYIDQVRAEGKPLFVYATAAWCVTCKINENVALNTQTVQNFFADEGIEVIMADWTNKGASIADYLQSFGRSGVPLYVFYPAGGEPILLPQLLTPSVVVDEITAAK